jgi:hypothetical protein
MLINGAAITVGKKERPLSTRKRSALIRLINFPESVYVILLTESF